MEIASGLHCHAYTIDRYLPFLALLHPVSILISNLTDKKDGP